jgi:hypothetical protein
MATRVFPKEAFTAEECQLKLRSEIFEAIDRHRAQHSGGRRPSSVLDVGCSIGLSTFYLADRYKEAKIEVLSDNFPHTATVYLRSYMYIHVVGYRFIPSFSSSCQIPPKFKSKYETNQMDARQC